MVETTSVKARAEYISETYDLPFKAGLALQLAEAGFSNSGIAKHIGVTESTARSYQRKCEERIGERVWEVLPRPRYDTFPTTPDDPEYSGDYVDIAPEFSPQERDTYKPKDLSELDIFQE